jgi:hypothetical protein
MNGLGRVRSFVTPSKSATRRNAALRSRRDGEVGIVEESKMEGNDRLLADSIAAWKTAISD